MKKFLLTLRQWSICGILFAGLCTLYSCKKEILSDENQDESITGSETRGIFDIRLDADRVHQSMDGFGFTQEEESTWASKEPYRSEIMNLLFDKEKGVGFSILRHKVGSGFSKPTIEPEKGVWNYTPDEREMWYLKKAMELGVDKIFGTVWTPPVWMKTNNKLTNGGYLKKECYQDYAEYLTQYAQIYARRGIPIWGISPANEPEFAAEWDSCLWPAEGFRNFIVNYWGPELEKQGVNLNIILGETAWWSEIKSIATLEDPRGKELVDVVATHHYMNIPAPLPFAKKHNKPVWMTETSETTSPFLTGIGNGLWWALRVHTCLTAGEASAFLYWRGAHTTDTDQTLIRVTDTPPYYTTSKKLFAIGQYSRFIRPGFVRIEIPQAPAAGIVMSAYKNPKTGQVVIVAININDREKTLPVEINNTDVTSFQSYVTDATRDLKQAESSLIDRSKKIALVLAPKSITTFVSDQTN